MNYYYMLGNVNNSVENLEKIKIMFRGRYSEFSAIFNLFYDFNLKLQIHSGLADEVKIQLEYLAENSIDPYDKTIPYKKCLYYLYTENYEMLENTINKAEEGYEEY